MALRLLWPFWTFTQISCPPQRTATENALSITPAVTWEPLAILVSKDFLVPLFSHRCWYYKCLWLSVVYPHLVELRWLETAHVFVFLYLQQMLCHLKRLPLHMAIICFLTVFMCSKSHRPLAVLLLRVSQDWYQGVADCFLISRTQLEKNPAFQDYLGFWVRIHVFQCAFLYKAVKNSLYLFLIYRIWGEGCSLFMSSSQ